MICCLLVALTALTGLSLVRPMRAIGLLPATTICQGAGRRHFVLVLEVVAAGITTALAVHTINRDTGHTPRPICSSLDRLVLPSYMNR
jgi:hypothetical protein